MQDYSKQFDFDKFWTAVERYVATPPSLEGMVFGNRFICRALEAIDSDPDSNGAEWFLSDARFCAFLEHYTDFLEASEESILIDDAFKAEVAIIDAKLTKEGLL